VQTAAHAYWTWRLARGRPRGGWAVLGAVAPDVPAIGIAAALLLRGVPREAVLEEVYQRPGRRQLHRAAHSMFAPALMALAARRSRAGRAVAAGWAGHLAVDYASHHTDAWPPLWPLRRRGWPSPLSYWEPDHHARAWSAAETIAVAAATALDRGLAARLAGAAVCLWVAGPALAPAGTNLWTARGLSP
jgi:hypothetical protein